MAASSDGPRIDFGPRSPMIAEWLLRAEARVDRLLREPTRTLPTAEVGASVKRLLATVADRGLKPTRIVVTAEGGISLWFGSNALIEVTHPSIAVMATRTTIGDDFVVSEIDLDGAVNRADTFAALRRAQSEAS